MTSTATLPGIPASGASGRAASPATLHRGLARAASGHRLPSGLRRPRRPSGIGRWWKAVRPALAFLSAQAVGAPPDVRCRGGGGRARSQLLAPPRRRDGSRTSNGGTDRRRGPCSGGAGDRYRRRPARARPRAVARAALFREERASVALTRATARMIRARPRISRSSRASTFPWRNACACRRTRPARCSGTPRPVGALLAGAEQPVVGAWRNSACTSASRFRPWTTCWASGAGRRRPASPSPATYRAHKKTLPVVAALAELSGGSGSQEDSDQLSRFLSNGLTEDDVMLAVSLIERGGGRERCGRGRPPASAGPRSLDRVRLGPAPGRARRARPIRLRRGTSRCRGRRRGDGPGWSPGHRWPRERARAGPASTSSVSSIPGGWWKERARDERHHGRRRPPAAAVPRDPHRGGDSPGGELDPVEAAPTRTWANFYGGPPAFPPPSRPTWRCAWPGTTRRRRAWPWPASTSGAREAWRAPGCSPTCGWPCSASGPGIRSRRSPGGDLPSGVVPAEHLRLRVLGSADDRGAHGRGRSSAESTARVLDRRAQDGIARARWRAASTWAGGSSAWIAPSVGTTPPFPTSRRLC